MTTERTARTGHDSELAKRTALLTALFIIFVALAVLFRVFLAAPAEQRAAAAPDSQFALVWEAWRVLENASGRTPPGPGLAASSLYDETLQQQAAARAIREMALALRVSPEALSKRLGEVDRDPPISVPDGLADVWRAWRVLHAEYPDVPPGLLAQAAIEGLAGNPEDPATRYLEASLYRGARDYFSGDSYEGIGAWVSTREEDQLPFISETFVGGPADMAGLRRGNVILTVNGISTKGLTVKEVTDLVKGPEGSRVELQVQGLEEGAQPRIVTVVRGVVNGPSLASDILEGDVGYIWLFRFHQGTGEEFRRTLQSLMDQGARALVLDLRYNPGGPLRGASGVASQFLSSGIVMYEITNDGKRLDWDIEKGGIARSLPLAVLANEASASSAEVVAGALQDAKRAKVYGNRSYGKGSVQTFQELSNGGALYVTVAHWYTPSGRQIQDYGIEPDVEAFPFRDGAGRTIDLPLALAYSDLLDVVQPLESEKK